MSELYTIKVIACGPAKLLLGLLSSRGPLC